jgi:hypothetical protein
MGCANSTTKAEAEFPRYALARGLGRLRRSAPPASAFARPRKQREAAPRGKGAREAPRFASRC